MEESRPGIVRLRRGPLAPAEPELVQQVAVAGAGAADLPKGNLLQVFWRRRWTVLSLTLATVAAAVIYLQRATPVYASSSQIFVQRSGPQILNEAQGAGASSGSYLYTQCELIRSSPILSMAAETAALSGGGGRVDNAVGYIRSGLSATVGKNNEIITVAFESTDREEAARVANSVVDAYMTYQSKQKRSTATEVLSILQKEKDKRDDELSGFLKQMLDFKRANPTLSFASDKGNVVTQRLGAISEALTAAQLDLIEARATRQAAEAVLNDPGRLRQAAPPELVASVDRGAADLNARLRELEADLQRRLDRGLSAAHPEVKVLRAEADRLNAEFAQEAQLTDGRLAGLYIATLEHDLSKKQYRAEELQKALDEQQGSAVALNVQSAEFSKLESELRRTERLVEILDNRIKELNITEDVGVMNVDILEVARPEARPVYPQKPRVLGVALVLGLVLGAGAGLLQDARDQRLRSADEIQALLGVQVLGIVPHMDASASVAQRGQKVHLEPASEFAEAYRTVRTAIYFGVPDASAKKMLITSPSPGDGKSTTASNIAIAMAMAGQRTVILDCDFRRPSQHKVFETAGHDVGLSTVIAGQSTLEAAIRRTPVEGLSLLPCGPIPPNPSELLNSQAFADLLDRLGTEFDHVIIDSPPVMAVTDARILAASADLTVLVLRAEKSTRKASELALESLVGVGANVLGVVVNDVPRGKGAGGYYGAYGYYSYGYGQGKKDRKAITNGDGAHNGVNGNHSGGEHDDDLVISRS